jgi:hypothetical protein
MNVNPTGRGQPAGASDSEPLRTDRTVSEDDQDVAATDPITGEKPVVIGPEKARAASTNRMPARVLLISVTLTAVAFLIGYLLVR